MPIEWAILIAVGVWLIERHNAWRQTFKIAKWLGSAALGVVILLILLFGLALFVGAGYVVTRVVRPVEERYNAAIGSAVEFWDDSFTRWMGMGNKR